MHFLAGVVINALKGGYMNFKSVEINLLSCLYVMTYMAHSLESKEPSSDFMAYKIMIWTYHGYEFSFGTLLTMVGQFGEENNCVTQTHTKVHCQLLCTY